MIRLFKVIRIFGVLLLLSYFAGFGPSQVVGKVIGKIKSQFGQSFLVAEDKDKRPVDIVKSGLKVAETSDEELCLPMGERDRKALAHATGTDVIRFLERSTADLHRAKAAEDQLKVMALHFDHRNWSKAWLGSEISPEVDSSGLNGAESLLQTNLSHASMVLSRYNRLLENGRRQEASALKAFHWQDEVRQEIRQEPVRLLVQSYQPYTCTKTDASYYGCAKGETIYRVKSLMSPRIACRFKDKREQYAVIYWIRVKDQQPKILEVDAKGNRLVKVTYDELEHRKLLSALSPNVTDVLHSAGLDPFRASVIWRQLNRPSGGVADGNRNPAAASGNLSAQPAREVPQESFQTDSY